jgi:hypothetical protein
VNEEKMLYGKEEIYPLPDIERGYDRRWFFKKGLYSPS